MDGGIGVAECVSALMRQIVRNAEIYRIFGVEMWGFTVLFE